MVDLSSEQRRQLDEIASELARDNPRLARALAGRWYAARRNTATPGRSRRARALGWLSISLLLAALPLLSVGVLLAQPVVILLGAVAMLTGPALLTATHTQWPPTA